MVSEAKKQPEVNHDSPIFVSSRLHFSSGETLTSPQKKRINPIIIVFLPLLSVMWLAGWGMMVVGERAEKWRHGY